MEFANHGSSRGRDEEASSSTTSTLQWAPPQAQSAPSSSTTTTVEKEHMFDKVVTPSDVGKLNRLVIPKQHAEKYFPLDTTTHEKGLLLNFEDRTGKPWRFRYSYWNSSQSYVMTKGWSRFVKERRLDAGDTVSFGRGVEDKDRFFIDWKRRPEIHGGLGRVPRIPLPLNYHPMVSFGTAVGPWGSMYNAGGCGGGRGGQFVAFRSAAGPPPPQSVVQLDGGGGDRIYQHPVVLDSVPVVQSVQAAAPKRVRLFGVNLDFPDSDASASFSLSASPSPKGKEREEPSLDLEM